MSRRRRTTTFLTIVGLVMPMGATVAPAMGSGDTETQAIAAKKHQCRKGKVALTFDDGPQPDVTRELLNVLRKRHVRATFFVQGYRARAHPKLIRRIKRAGHRIGNHTWNHKDLTGLSKRKIRSQLVRANRAITQAGAPRPTLMRPPYGATDDRVASVAKHLNLHSVLWNIDTRNWAGISEDAIVHRALSAIGPGDNIILLHDGVAYSGRTVEAVPRIIHGIRKRGYCVAPLTRRGDARRPYHRLRKKHWSTKSW